MYNLEQHFYELGTEHLFEICNELRLAERQFVASLGGLNGEVGLDTFHLFDADAFVQQSFGIGCKIFLECICLFGLDNYLAVFCHLLGEFGDEALHELGIRRSCLYAVRSDLVCQQIEVAGEWINKKQ